ncbi:hypothetical protein [Nonlabens ulvanivorans]|uniref:hypothetical protein n=1 Tax=Nonlabens ulvanivorans TaxID=906888 RepID=UPI0032631BF8
MSVLKGRKSSVLRFDTEKQILSIEDHLRSYRKMQIVLLCSSILWCTVIIINEVSSFWLGFLIGAYVAVALFAIYYYLFKSTVVKSIPFNEIEELISITLFSKNDRRLTLKLKSERYRNLIIMNQSDINLIIDSFKEIAIPVRERTTFNLLPLNF